jgi:hypothetical protein
MRNLVKGILASTFAASLAFGAAGCGKSAATCENAADHVISIMKNSDEMKKMPDEMKKQFEEGIKGARGEMVQKCKDDKWSAKDLACAMAAKSMPDMEKCDPKKSGGEAK